MVRICSVLAVIMAVFMVMFMMNPAGLNPMTMVHQHKAAVAGGVIAFAALGGIGVFARFPDRPATPTRVTVDLGEELLGGSMLVFESAGVALLATMIAAISLASTRGRYGAADDGSDAPALDPDRPFGDRPIEPAASAPSPTPSDPMKSTGGTGGTDHGTMT